MSTALHYIACMVDLDPLLKALGERVRARREDLGLTRRELAERAELSERFLAQVERGRGNIAITRLAALARALGVSVAELTVEPSQDPLGSDARSVLALLGVRGAGKSSLGRTAGQALSIDFSELDAIVEDVAGVDLGELFSIHGEDYYRRLAGRTLDRMLSSTDEPLILAVGGGVVLDEEAYDLLLRRTHTVWLRASADDHWNRVVAQGDSRPMSTRPDARNELAQLLARREPLYARAEHHVDTTALGWDESLARVVALARTLGGRA